MEGKLTLVPFRGQEYTEPSLLLHLLLPLLSSLETTRPESSTSTSTEIIVPWLRQDAGDVWYRALLAAMGHVIVDVARLMVEQAFVLTLETWQVQLPRPGLRKILRSRPTFNAHHAQLEIREYLIRQLDKQQKNSSYSMTMSRRIEALARFEHGANDSAKTATRPEDFFKLPEEQEAMIRYHDGYEDFFRVKWVGGTVLTCHIAMM